MPASACDLIELLAAKLVTVAAPTLMKVPEGEPVPDLAKLDVMLTEALSFGDAKIDSLLTESTTKISGAYETVKATVTEKVGGAKSFVYGKVEENKTLVIGKVEQVKAAVTSKIEEEQIAAMRSKAELYYTTAKDNVEPAKTVFGNLAATAKAGITEKGYVGYAKETAEVLKVQGLETMEVLKTKGAVEGVKEIAGDVIKTVVSALDDAKATADDAAGDATEPAAEVGDADAADNCGLGEDEAAFDDAEDEDDQ